MSIFDRFYRPYKDPVTPPPKGSDVKQGEFGIIVSSIYKSKDFQYYNPDDLLQKRGYSVYKKMLTDDQVKAVLRFKQNAITSRKWYFDIDESDEQKAKEYEKMADFFKFAINHIVGSWRDKLVEILSALKSGFSICEKIYEPISWDGRSYWGLRDMKLRPFETFDGGFRCDKHGNLLEIKQTNIGQTDITLPIDKVIHFVNQPDENRFYGESDLKAAFRPWWGKDIAIKFQNIHLERHAHGFVYAKIGEKGLSAPERVNLESVLANIQVQTAMIVPEAVELDTMQPLNTIAYRDAIASYDRAIARSVLVPNLLGVSEQGQHGSFAQSKTQLIAFFWILDDIDERLSEVLNEQMFRQLAMWNFGSDDFPRYKTEGLTDEQKIELAKAWAEMVSKGAVKRTDADENYWRKELGLPEKKEEEIEEPSDEIPPENAPVEIPKIDQWINEQENPKLIKKIFAQRPWLKRINFAKLDRRWMNQDERMIESLLDITAGIRQAIDKQVIKIGGERSWGNVKPKEIESINLPKRLFTDLRKTLRTNLTDALDEAFEQARRELPPRKYRRIGVGMDKTQAEKFIQQKTMQIAGVLENEILNKVKNTLANSISYDKSLKDTVKQLDDDLGELLPKVDAAGHAVNRPARLENIARTNVADATNKARGALFSDPELQGFVQAYEYSAILDGRTTEICEELNGRIFRDFGHYTPPNHYQCRSVLAAITIVDDWDGKESKAPRVQPQKGFK